MKKILFIFTLVFSMGAQAQDLEPSSEYKTCYLVEVAASSAMEKRQEGVRKAVVIEAIRKSDLDIAVKNMALAEVEAVYRAPILINASERDITILVTEWANARYDACFAALNGQQ